MNQIKLNEALDNLPRSVRRIKKEYEEFIQNNFSDKYNISLKFYDYKTKYLTFKYKENILLKLNFDLFKEYGIKIDFYISDKYPFVPPIIYYNEYKNNNWKNIDKYCEKNNNDIKNIIKEYVNEYNIDKKEFIYYYEKLYNKYEKNKEDILKKKYKYTTMIENNYHPSLRLYEIIDLIIELLNYEKKKELEMKIELKENQK